MKKKIIATYAFMAIVGVFALQKTYFHKSAESIDNLLLAENVLALSDQGTDGVKCYCTKGIWKKHYCTANASGAFCGNGDCWNYDGNCRN